MTASLPPILIGDDEETDRLIWNLAFERATIANPIVFRSNGLEVVDYLAANPLPRMLLLDLKMPRMDGFDVLVWIITKKEFRKLPVFVFSSSSHEGDIEKVKQLGARDYFVKPHALSDWVQILRGLHSRCE